MNELKCGYLGLYVGYFAFEKKKWVSYRLWQQSAFKEHSERFRIYA